MRRLLFYILLIWNCTNTQNVFSQRDTSRPLISRPLHNPPEIINSYTEVLQFDICTNAITVSNDSSFKTGDTVLIIQMKGAVIDTTNTASFGTILSYGNCGNYEFNYIVRKSGNTITLKNRLTKSYDIPNGIVQLIRVPLLDNATFSDGLTCLPWNGTKGGVLAVIAKNGLSSLADIDVTGRGFRGGEGYNAILPPLNCSENNYYYSSASQLAAFKGESIASLSSAIIKGKGNAANAGGGGLSHNSGGGGGGNGGSGGFGGYQTDSCGNPPFDNRGIGARSLFYNASADKIFMGGGGGNGHTDNIDNNSPATVGGSGGGIIIIIADSLDLSSHHSITAIGNSGTYCYSPNCNDGMGGGGGGGTILLDIKKLSGVTVVNASGGDGANVLSPVIPGGRPGPGGGGGGGVIFISDPSLPASMSTIVAGGINGAVVLDGNNPWGSTKGTDGLQFYNLTLPLDTVLFKPNIDSVKIKDSATSCNSYDFRGLGYTNTYPIATWQWNFADGGTALTQNATHDFLTSGTFPVKLIITDINGCKDSITKNITSTAITVDAGTGNTICTSTSIILQGSVNGATQYTWSPAVYLSNPTILNPVATPPVTTLFYLTVTNSQGCIAKDSVLINVFSPNGSITSPLDLIPSAFTPNNDGLNDCFGIKYPATIIEIEFSIFNRWGEEVFHTTNPSDCWDGKYKGIPQNTAVFIYMIKARTTCQPSVFKKGTLILLR